MTVIYDQNGRPFEKSKIERAGGRAQLVHDQATYHEEVIAPGITPERLARVLHQNDAGDTTDLLTLSYEMEERDLHYAAQIQTRTNAIAYTKIRSEASRKNRDSKQAKDIAEVFQEEVVDQPNFRELLASLMDAIPKGYSVVQPIWDTATRPWTFKEFSHIDPRCFTYDRDTRSQLRIKDERYDDGRPIPSGLFLVHNPRIRTGIKIRDSVARMVAINWFCKTSSVQDWLAFAEVYGMPIRIGRYNPAKVTDEEKATLRMALVNLGHDASAMIPDTMKIDFADARRPTSGDNVYGSIVNYLDQQTSRAILGQVLAADARATGLGTAIADLHREVRQDILEADASAVMATVKHLVRMWTQLNFGLAAPVPHVRLDIAPPQDLAKFTTGVLPWFVQGGLEIPKDWLYETLQIPVPEKGEETVKAPLAPGTPGAGGATPGVKSTSKKQRTAPK